MERKEKSSSNPPPLYAPFQSEQEGLHCWFRCWTLDQNLSEFCFQLYQNISLIFSKLPNESEIDV